MCVRTSGASELRKFWHFYILKLLFLSIFCQYNRYFLSTNGMLVGLHVPTNFQIYRQTLTLSKCMCMRASELRKCWHFYILKLLFLSIFCRYSRYFVGTNDMLVGLHIPTNFLIYRQTVTLSKCMCMRASGASELRKFLHFYIVNLLFLSIFCRYIRYFVGTNDMLVGSHVPTNFLIYRQTVTLSKCMCMRASGASELRKFWHFYILNLLFLSIFCRYIRYFVGTNDMLVGSHVPTNFQMYRQKSEKALLGGGGQLPPLPPPPSLWLR